MSRFAIWCLFHSSPVRSAVTRRTSEYIKSPYTAQCIMLLFGVQSFVPCKSGERYRPELCKEALLIASLASQKLSPYCHLSAPCCSDLSAHGSSRSLARSGVRHPANQCMRSSDLARHIWGGDVQRTPERYSQQLLQ